MKREILGIDPNEQVLLDVRRHPIGVVGFIGFGVLTMLILLILLFVLISTLDLSGGAITALTLGGIAMGLFVAFIVIVAIYIYRANELIVTNENIVQILRQSLIDKKVSQLNLSKVQDVSVDQEGWFPTIFNYGTIGIETAGEAKNYVFSHVANPSVVAKRIVEAHERYVDSINGFAGSDGI